MARCAHETAPASLAAARRRVFLTGATGNWDRAILRTIREHGQFGATTVRCMLLGQTRRYEGYRSVKG